MLVKKSRDDAEGDGSACSLGKKAEFVGTIQNRQHFFGGVLFHKPSPSKEREKHVAEHARIHKRAKKNITTGVNSNAPAASGMNNVCWA